MKLKTYNLIDRSSGKIVSKNHKLTDYEVGMKNNGYATNQSSLRYERV